MTLHRSIAWSFAALAVAAPIWAQDAQAPAALDEAKAAFKVNDFQTALDAAVRALADNPTSAVANYIAGTSSARLGQFDDGERYLGAAEAESPNMAGLQYQFANLAFTKADAIEKVGREAEAMPLYQAAADRCTKELERKNSQSGPFAGPCLSTRAVALGRAGDVEGSIAAHEAWGAVVQGNAPWVSLAAMFTRARRVPEALAVLERLPVTEPDAVEEASYVVAQTMFQTRQFDGAEAAGRRGVAAKGSSSRCWALVVASHAERDQIEEAAESLRTYLALSPPAAEAEQVGRIFEKHFGEGANPVPAPDGARRPVPEKLGAPRYPKAALRSNIQTQVLVVARVLADGTVSETFLAPSRIADELRTYGFEDSAFEAVRRSRFMPGTRNGSPVDMWVAVPMAFRP